MKTNIYALRATYSALEVIFDIRKGERNSQMQTVRNLLDSGDFSQNNLVSEAQDLQELDDQVDGLDETLKQLRELLSEADNKPLTESERTSGDIQIEFGMLQAFV